MESKENNRVKEVFVGIYDFFDRHRVIKCITFIVTVFLILAIMISWFIHAYYNPNPELTDNYIKRPYSQLLRVLDEAPADITKQPYEENFPDLVQEDIQRMLDADKDLKILYYGDETYIEISEYVTGINVTISERAGFSPTSVMENISMYKSGDSIFIYGGSSGERRISKSIEVNETSMDYDFLNNSNMDLYGATNVEYDNVLCYNEEMSLVRSGNDFMFYKLGKQVGETVSFPGGTIIDFNYHYILDDKKDLYYMYYNANPSNFWIKFIKVDTDVDEVLVEDEESVYAMMPYFNHYEDEISLVYPIYLKDGKRFTGISNVELEEAFGCNYGKHNYDTSDASAFNYDITVIELSEENVSSVILNLEDSYVYDDGWYIRYNYANGTVYIKERVNGLDSYLLKNIPKNEINKFDGKELKPEEIDSTIKELKLLYDKYSNM